MGKRREVREQTVKLLYSSDLSSAGNSKHLESDQIWHLIGAEGGAPSAAIRKASEELVKKVLENQAQLDQMISNYTANYGIERIAAVDRNILRLALYEMHHRLEVPPVVAINEAIEIAKKFGSEDSGRFVNGVLDRAKSDLSRPLRDPQPSQSE